MGNVKYYDIGLNLFCKQFSDSEKIIKEAEDHEVCCILTGTDMKENKKINDFVKTHNIFGRLEYIRIMQIVQGKKILNL